MDPATLLRIMAKNQGTEMPISIIRQTSLPPIKVNGKSYLQLCLLKETASSKVHKAASPRDNEQLDRYGQGRRTNCAIKRVKGASEAEQIQREITILTRLGAEHGAERHVVRLLDAEVTFDQITLVMEYGELDLSQWQPNDAHSLLGYLRQCFEALSWTHLHQILHVSKACPPGRPRKQHCAMSHQALGFFT